jgi:hypothetical protein
VGPDRAPVAAVTPTVFASVAAKFRRAPKRRALVAAIVLALVVAIIVAAVALGGSDAPKTAPAGGASTTTQVGATQPSQTTPGVIIVTVAGSITKILPNGDLGLNDRRVDYTITMSSSPKIVDQNGADVTRDVIQVGGTVQVTGTLTGTTIAAQTMIVPTNPEPVPTTS